MSLSAIFLSFSLLFAFFSPTRNITQQISCLISSNYIKFDFLILQTTSYFCFANNRKNKKNINIFVADSSVDVNMSSLCS